MEVIKRRLTLHPNVFIWYNENIGVAYDSKYLKGFRFVNTPNISRILKNLDRPESLYSTVITEDSSDVTSWVETLISHEMGETTAEECTPFTSIKPILKVQNNRGMLIAQFRQGITSSFRDLIHRIIINFGDSLYGDDLYARQINFPTKEVYNPAEMAEILRFVNQACDSLLLNKIYIVGIPELEESRFLDFLNQIKMQRNVCFVLPIERVKGNLKLVEKLLDLGQLEIVFTPSSWDEAVCPIENSNVEYNLIVQDKQDLQWIEAQKFTKGINPMPIFNGQNKEFFETEVFMTEEEIISGAKLSKREIFINQELNLYDFGTFYVSGNGQVYTNSAHKPVGSISDSPLSLAIKEVFEGKSWFNIRNDGKCKNCPYHYLCPPKAHFEEVMEIESICKF